MASDPFEQLAPYTVRETARMVGLGFRITRRQAKGKPTKALEKKADQLQKQAEERAAKARKKQ
ncbi:hypothetical protein AB0P02_21505 [Streptomyces griseoluteus]|uniref:hypothetical protein n=1 Tax=Streptomyces griseoluteus TaxID=29306 RepID=UPI00341ED1E1